MGNINNKQNWNRKRDANVSQMSRIQRGNVELSSGLNDSSTSVVTPPSSLPFAPPIFLPIPLSYPHNTLLRSPFCLRDPLPPEVREREESRVEGQVLVAGGYGIRTRAGGVHAPEQPVGHCTLRRGGVHSPEQPLVHGHLPC